MDDVELQAALIDSRNADGGWPFRRGNSWTEPTALGLLALRTTGVSSKTRASSASWLSNRQTKDGGWPPGGTVSESTWVTSLALLALADERGYSEGCPKAVAWLLRHVYPEQAGLQSLLQRTLGFAPSRAPGSVPWFPGTAGWVIPTALTSLALTRWSKQTKTVDLRQPIEESQNYLLGRRCPDGGWNHGGALQRSENSVSYPETTGLALLALADVPIGKLRPAVELAEQFLQQSHSTEGICWLLMGLAAHGISKDAETLLTRPAGTTSESALCLIARQAVRGKNPFLPDKDA